MNALVKNVSLKALKLMAVVTLCVASLIPLVGNSYIVVGPGYGYGHRFYYHNYYNRHYHYYHYYR